MANKYTGTKTEKNLQEAFSGESQARNKYTYFASVAKKEGYEQIAALFLKTADNEKEHAKMWFKELMGIGDTTANLGAAADGDIAAGNAGGRLGQSGRDGERGEGRDERQAHDALRSIASPVLPQHNGAGKALMRALCRVVEAKRPPGGGRFGRNYSTATTMPGD